MKVRLKCLILALSERRPFSRSVWMRCGQLDFGTLTEVKQLVPFHHDPNHTDTDLDRLIAQAIEEAKPGYQVTPGIEGAIFEL